MRVFLKYNYKNNITTYVILFQQFQTKRTIPNKTWRRVWRRWAWLTARSCPATTSTRTTMSKSSLNTRKNKLINYQFTSRCIRNNNIFKSCFVNNYPKHYETVASTYFSQLKSLRMKGCWNLEHFEFHKVLKFLQHRPGGASRLRAVQDGRHRADRTRNAVHFCRQRPR